MLKILCQILVNFYRGAIESTLTGNWDQQALQRVIKTTQNITGTHLPSISVICKRMCLHGAQRIQKDNTHPNHSLLTLLLSGIIHKYRLPPDHRAASFRWL